ncbi:MAG: DUF4375 domain-containing protein [Xanthomonadales bacterium]|nr:DUF4375 domain-containing protein [Xanthomonadales bacterium]
MELEEMDSWHRRLAELAATEPGADFGLLWLMLHARVFVDDRGSGYRRLPSAGKTIWVVNCFIGEVHNGGFHQFFSNSAGDHAAELPAALTEVGALSMLALFRRAARILSKDGVVPVDRVQRNDKLDSIFPDEDDCYAAFHDLDAEFYALPPADQPDLMRYAYDHREQLDFTLAEYERALESEPHLAFPGDRLARVHHDKRTDEIQLELASGHRSIPTRELRSLSIAKLPASRGTSGLVYRLQTSTDTIDLPFFARGDSVRNTPSWSFLRIKQTYPLLALRDALAEIRNPNSMQTFEIWSRSQQ